MSIVKIDQNSGIDFECFGAFSVPENYTILVNTEYVDEDEVDESYFNTEEDINIYVSTEEDVTSKYTELVDKLMQDDNLGECSVVAMFLNGDDSCLISTDTADGSGSMSLVADKFEDYAHCHKSKVEQESPVTYSRIKQFFHNKW